MHPTINPSAATAAKSEAQTGLFQSLNALKNIFDDVPYAVAFLRGPDLILEFINKHNLMLWHRTRNEVQGKPLLDVFPGDTDMVAALHHEIYRTGKRYVANEVPIELQEADGPRTRWYNVVIDLVHDEVGEVLGQIATSIDVSAQVLARKAAEANERTLRELANAMPQLVWMAEPDGTVTYYNDRVSEFAGATKTAEGLWTWEGLVHADDLQHTTDAWLKAVRDGIAYEAEHRIHMKDGSYRWHLSRGLPQRDATGNVFKWFGTATDIHEQKNSAERLEALVAERTSELERSNEDLQQFAHVASHDLKEPLRKVRTFGNRLEVEYGGALPDKARLYLNKMQASAERMSGLIDGVLNYSSLDAIKSSAEKVDLNHLMDVIESDLEIVIQQTAAVIKRGQLPTVIGSTVLLNQLFLQPAQQCAQVYKGWYSAGYQPLLIP